MTIMRSKSAARLSARLAVLGLLGFAAACGSEPAMAPEAATETTQAPAPGGALSFSLSSNFVGFGVANVGQVPAPQTITMFNSLAMIPALGVKVGPISYQGTFTGWLSYTVKIVGLTAQITFTATGAPAMGGYIATVPVSLAGGTPQMVTVGYGVGRFFQDDLNNSAGWTLSGLWNFSALTGICNTSKPGECLPGPAEGTGALWYGSPTSGDFDFGTNSGSAVSPSFFMPGTVALPTQVRFATFFEIEFDVSPLSFDFMEVYLRNTGTGTRTFVGRLQQLPGFTGRQLTYLDVALDVPGGLPPGNYQVELAFSTRDPIANDYRGWVVDRLRVVPSVLPPGFAAGVNGENAGGLVVIPAGASPEFVPLIKR